MQDIVYAREPIKQKVCYKLKPLFNKSRFSPLVYRIAYKIPNLYTSSIARYLKNVDLDPYLA